MRLKIFDRFRGSGEYSVSVPPMDGPLKPNDRLDMADALHSAAGVDNLCENAEAIWFSAGSTLFRAGWKSGGTGVAAEKTFDSDISFLAGYGQTLAIGLEEGAIVLRGGPHNGTRIDELGGRKVVCPTAATFSDDNTLILCLGSQDHRPSDWKRDLLLKKTSGSLWLYDLSNGTARLVQDKLAFPCGVTLTPERQMLVSESWRHRILKISNTDARVLMDDLPFYPGRLSLADDGSIVLCGFAPRRQMVEFILHEPEFLHRMLAEVPEPYWMAPSLRSGKDFLEPLQGGQIRHHGVLKPWSPTKSYGLVVVMSSEGQLLGSMHSRAGGDRHGITSAIAQDGRILASSKGGDVILSITAEVQ